MGNFEWCHLKNAKNYGQKGPIDAVYAEGVTEDRVVEIPTYLMISQMNFVENDALELEHINNAQTFLIF